MQHQTTENTSQTLTDAIPLPDRAPAVTLIGVVAASPLLAFTVSQYVAALFGA